MGKLVFSFLVLMAFINLSLAETPEEKGLKIAQDSRERTRGYIGDESDMKMILIDAHGVETVREMQGKVLEVTGDGTRSLSIFLTPKDVKGTKMLTWNHPDTDDDQWLFLPSLRRVKRISSSNKSSSFMGSEFSYEDLGSQEVEKYNYKWLRDDKVDGEDCWVLERIPKKDSGYSKQTIYLSKKYNNPLKVDYYDRRAELLKTAMFSGHQEFPVGNKKFWMASKIHIKNIQTQKQSIFTWEKRKLGVKFSQKDFDTKSLE
ncbi:MAG: outer membrane lipoprotein-sorting protein [Bdellovibrio sp.]|nr:outer membrane lipoprotein-sorting protein [Bdellovibrio sp.]